MNITVDVNSKALRQAFIKAPVKTTRAIKQWIDTTAALTERVEKQEVPVRTGRLQNSVFSVSSGAKAEVKPNVKYAIFVHNGTRHMKANPFANRTYAKVRPMADRNADIIISGLVRSI